jgi:hypothetical protein
MIGENLLNHIRARVLEEYDYPYKVAALAGVKSSGSDSEGGKWLLGLRNAFLENLEAILTADYPEDFTREICSQAGLCSNTAEIWQVFTDIEAYDYDYPEDIQTGDLTQAAGSYLDDIAEGIASNLLTEVQGWVADIELESADEDEDERPDLANKPSADRITVSVSSSAITFTG